VVSYFKRRGGAIALGYADSDRSSYNLNLFKREFKGETLFKSPLYFITGSLLKADNQRKA
jgi:hypothetical protein